MWICFIILLWTPHRYVFQPHLMCTYEEWSQHFFLSHFLLLKRCRSHSQIVNLSIRRMVAWWMEKAYYFQWNVYFFLNSKLALIDCHHLSFMRTVSGKNVFFFGVYDNALDLEKLFRFHFTIIQTSSLVIATRVCEFDKNLKNKLIEFHLHLQCSC